MILSLRFSLCMLLLVLQDFIRYVDTCQMKGASGVQKFPLDSGHFSIHGFYETMNAAPCGSHPTFIGSVPEKCYRNSPNLYYIIDVEGTGPQGQLQAQGHLTSFAIRHKDPGHSIP